jgi:hypothetical protein
MKKLKCVSLIICFLFSIKTNAQLKIGNNPNTISSSSVLEMESTDKGVLVPRMLSVQRVAIVSPALGLLVYDTDTNSFWQYNGLAWVEISNYWIKTGNDISNINTGNVGINTVTPSAYGHGGVNKIFEVFNNNSSLNAQSHLMLSTNGISGSTGGITWASPSLTSSDKRTGFIGNAHEALSTVAAPSSAITFYTTNSGALSEKMRVSSGGNIGIGTTTPGYPLNFANAIGDKISLYGNTSSHYGFGIQAGLLQIHTDIAASNIVFGYGSSASFNERARIVNSGTDGMFLNGRLHLKNGSLPLDVNQTPGVWLYKADNSGLLGFMGTHNNNNIGFFGGPVGWGFTYDAINSNVGINNTTPVSKFDLSTTGIGLAGAAMSSAVRTNAGNIGTTFGSEVNLASIGFKAGGNNTALGLRGFRNAAGNDWTGTALLLEYDVDNTTRPAGGGSGFIALGANGNVGIGNGAPAEKLDISGKIKIVDGTQGIDRVLKSDANGVGTWVTSTATKSAINGVFSGAGSTLSSTTYVPTGAYIDLPYGKWSINGTYLIAGAFFPSANSSVWIRTSFSDGTTGTYPANVSTDMQGSVLISGTLISPNIYGVINGQIIIQNNTSPPNTGITKRYYMWASVERFGNTPGTYNINGFANNSAENQMIAYPMN